MPLRSVLADHQSAPLVQDLKVINKVSQNLHAELILRLLGRERGRSGTVEGGLEVMRNWLFRPASSRMSTCFTTVRGYRAKTW